MISHWFQIDFLYRKYGGIDYLLSLSTLVEYL